VQDRYAGDVGDYIKMALLRALSPGRRLGVLWYLFPDEGHNNDGKHTDYLQRASEWRALDPELFDALHQIAHGERSVGRLESSVVLDATFFRDAIVTDRYSAATRSQIRSEWFAAGKGAVEGCDLVFADPDNGLVDNSPQRRRRKGFGKQMPLSEALALADGRSAIIYHHNSRFPGGHDLEVDQWLAQLGNAVAIRANAYSCRTFFLINPDAELLSRARNFCVRWSAQRVSLHA
jgi:hypothetical protein